MSSIIKKRNFYIIYFFFIIWCLVYGILGREETKKVEERRGEEDSIYWVLVLGIVF